MVGYGVVSVGLWGLRAACAMVRIRSTRPEDLQSIQHSHGGARQRTHAYRPGFARYSLAELSRVDAPFPSRKQAASRGKGEGTTGKNTRTRRPGDCRGEKRRLCVAVVCKCHE